MFLNKDDRIINMLRVKLDLSTDIISDDKLLETTRNTFVRRDVDLKIAMIDFKKGGKNKNGKIDKKAYEQKRTFRKK